MKCSTELAAAKVRRGIVEAVYRAKSGHPGGSLSIADILSVLYFEEMSYDDVATVLKKSRKQVGNLAYRAKQALEAELVKEGFNYENG